MNTKHIVPETGYLRLKQIIGAPNAEPPIPPIIPVSKATWWDGVKKGRYPKAYKIAPRCTVWKIEDIRVLIEQAGS